MDMTRLLAGVAVEPRPYQHRIISQAVAAFLEGGLRSVLIDSPTGSGKTVMGLLIARALQQRLGVRVGWVAMRRNLLAQAAAENARRRLGVEAAFVSMFDRDPPRPLDMLVVDEAQHDAAGSMAHLHNLIRPRYILGLSATPFRADRVKLCFDRVLKDAGIHRLIQDGYLSPYFHYTLPEYTPRTVAECYAREPERWGRALVTFHTIDQCRQAAALLHARGVACDVVTGDSDREGQIDAFRAGRLRVLFNCLVLAEGFDCPELHTVFCRPSCKSVTIQTCGRVFRRHPGLPFKQVVQCKHTRLPFLRTATAARQNIGGVDGWRSVQVNPLIEKVSGRTLAVLARTEVSLPDFLARTASRSGRRRRGRRRDADGDEGGPDLTL